MNEFPYISGVDIHSIENKEFLKLETTKSADILFALDKRKVPYSAKHGEKMLVLTYDGRYKAEVEEIIAKVRSVAYDFLLREIKNKKNEEGSLVLLPEVAEALNTSVGTLKERPIEVQELLCKTYIDLWMCDTYTIQRELDRILTVNGKTLSEMQEYERKEFQVNNTPKKCEQAEISDNAHRRSVMTNAENHRIKAERTARETARTAYITREMRRRNAMELQRKLAESKSVPQCDERERNRKP